MSQPVQELHELPEDIRRAASKALAGEDEMAGHTCGELLERIARAIMAERERCAEIADCHADALDEGEAPHGQHMTSMVERVARALAKADRKDPDAPAWIKYPGPEIYGVCWRDQYADKARAAIAAMREPTKAMTDALDSFGAPLGIIEEGWQAAIDAALAE